MNARVEGPGTRKNLSSLAWIPDWAGYVLLGLALVSFLSPISETSKAWVNNAIFLFFLLSTCWGCARRALKEPEAALGWRWLTAACSLAALGATAMMVSLFEVGPRAGPPAFGVFTLWTLAQMAMGLGLISFPRPKVEARIQIRAFLDASIFALSMFLIIWLLFLQKLLGSTSTKLATEIAVGLFFLTVAGNLGFSTHVISGGRAIWKGPLGAFNMGTFGMAILMIPYVETVLRATYHQAHPVVLLMMPIWFFFFLVPRRPWPTRGASLEKPRMAMQDILPFLPTFLASGAILAVYLPGTQRDQRVGLTLFLFLALLVMLRQFTTLKDVREHSEDLEGKVEVSARDLVASQHLILQTQRMNMVGSIGAGLAHDVNNLIGAAKNYIELIQMDLDDAITVNSADIQKVHQALSKAGDMTRQLLGFARQREGVMDVFDLNIQILGLRPLLAIIIPKGITLEVYPSVEPLLVRADPAQIDQVVVNFVSNAKDAMPGKGTIRLSTALRAPVGENLEWVTLEVHDTGSGMPQEVIAKIFDPFFTTKEPGKGTGLGLSSVRTVVEGLEGRLEVDSRPGGGTTMRVLLPRVAS